MGRSRGKGALTPWRCAYCNERDGGRENRHDADAQPAHHETTWPMTELPGIGGVKINMCGGRPSSKYQWYAAAEA